MNLNGFSEMYFKLKNKALEIMEIYQLGNYSFEAIEVEEKNCTLQFNINIYEQESKNLSFDLEEMNNDIEYFKTKYEKEKELEKIKVEEEIQREKKRRRLLEEKKRRRLLEEMREIMEYQRLKKKFESDSK